jgi:hypothetical protein
VRQEIMATGDKNGRSTVYMTDISGGPALMPVAKP